MNYSIKKFPFSRMRRLRMKPFIRNLVSETSISCNDLIWPVFICDGKNKKEEISSMPNVYRYSIDQLDEISETANELGINLVALFPYIPEEKKTLIDVGCGDGVWSIVLSNHFNVTGIDNSEQGIINAKNWAKKFNKNINFICGDIKDIKEKYDVVFCRCPSFFGGYEPEHPIFKKFLPIVLNLCKKTFYFIVYSRPPFSTYANEKKTSYFHDPDILKNLFENYGKVDLKYEKNYIILKLTI